MDARSLQNGCEFLCFVCRGGVSPPVLHKFVGWGDPSPTGIKCRTTLKSVGATIGRPRAIRESPLHQKQQTPSKPVGAGVPDCPGKTQCYFYKWREDNILPYRQNIKNPTNLVGTVRPYLLCKLTVLFKQNDIFINDGRPLGKPQVFFENIANPPYKRIISLSSFSFCGGGARSCRLR